MNNCNQCNQPYEVGANFCPHCGKGFGGDNSTDRRNNSTLLTVLCILTILGSIFTIFRALLYEMISEFDINSNYIRGWIYAGSAIGTLIGAIIMLKRKLLGLYMYTASQVIYIVTVLIAFLNYESFGGFALFITLIFVVPSVIFLMLYWTDKVKDNLS